MEFCLCILFSKIPNAPILLRKGTVCILVIFLCIPKLPNQFWVIKCVAKDILKYGDIFSEIPFLPFHFFFLCCIFKNAKGIFFSSSSGSNADPAQLSLPG